MAASSSGRAKPVAGHRRAALIITALCLLAAVACAFSFSYEVVVVTVSSDAVQLPWRRQIIQQEPERLEKQQEKRPAWQSIAGTALPKSAGRRRQAWWQRFHETIAEEMYEKDRKEGWDVIFYGDGIVETWRGTEVNKPCARCEGAPELFQQRFGAYSKTKDSPKHKYKSYAAGISGDQTAHLLWRLSNGELPERHLPKVVVVMVGRNELRLLEKTKEDPMLGAPGTAFRLQEIVHELRTSVPRSQVLLVGLLPFGTEKASNTTWPNVFTPALDYVNVAMQQMASADRHIHFVNCQKKFLVGGEEINTDLLPDAFQPSLKGMHTLASCVKPKVDDLLQKIQTAECLRKPKLNHALCRELRESAGPPEMALESSAAHRTLTAAHLALLVTLAIALAI